MAEKKFYLMSRDERWKYLEEKGIDPSLKEEFNKKSPDGEIIENIIGEGVLPIGIIKQLRVNGNDYIVPMMIEEPSVVAAANKASKLTLPDGFKSTVEGWEMIGQIQFTNLERSTWETIKLFEENRDEIEKKVKEMTKPMEKYGGGFRAIYAREIYTPRGPNVVVEFLIDTADAMGANTINTIAEEIGPFIGEKIRAKYRLRILSNLAIYRRVKSRAVWRREVLEKDANHKGINENPVDAILDAWAFAYSDVFRLTTNNKGIMNGIDAVALATGQDWRAIEAGAHMFSAFNGFKPLANYWKDKEGNLVGEIDVPMPVASVGGAIRSLPHARASLKLMGVKSAKELAMIMASVGLANNFAAMYALSTEGINKGHMRLHAVNLILMTGVKERDKIDKIIETMEKENIKITFENVKKVIKRLK